MVKRWLVLPRGTRWTIGGIAAVVLGLAVAWAAFVPLADWLAHRDVGPVTGSLHETAVDNARGLLLTLGAGLVAAGALAFTALNFNLLRRNSEQADQWQRRTHELTEQGQVTDRYTKAVEQLGSDKLDVRIGGIYALERIARDSARDHPVVMEMLAAFIREHSHERWPPPGPDGAQPEHSSGTNTDDTEPERSPRPDIQAALTVVGRRVAESDVRPIDLSGADLAGADLSNADLTGARLDYATLSGGILADAHLAEAHLYKANLHGVVLQRADLTGAFLAAADLTASYVYGGQLAGANLADAILRGTGLVLADLTGARLDGSDLTGAVLEGADFTGADLAHADLTGVSIGPVCFPPALGRADLDAANFSRAKLDDAKWPTDVPSPEGWKLNPGSGRLERVITNSTPTERP